MTDPDISAPPKVLRRVPEIDAIPIGVGEIDHLNSLGFSACHRGYKRDRLTADSSLSLSKRCVF